MRNEVVRLLAEGTPEIDGIVEEGWPSPNTSPTPCSSSTPTPNKELQTNVVRMLDVSACLDLARLRSATMSEYLVAPLG